MRVLRKCLAQQQRNKPATDSLVLQRCKHAKAIERCLAVLIPERADGDRLSVEPRKVLLARIGRERKRHEMRRALRFLRETVRADL